MTDLIALGNSPKQLLAAINKALQELDTPEGGSGNDGTEGLAYTIDEALGIAICTGMGTATKPYIKIASKVNGFPVTEIAENAFRNNMIIKMVEIPFGVRFIRGEAFAYSTIESVVIPSTVSGMTLNDSNINAYAFSYCSSLTRVLYEGRMVDWKTLFQPINDSWGESSQFQGVSDSCTVYCADGKTLKNGVVDMYGGTNVEVEYPYYYGYTTSEQLNGVDGLEVSPAVGLKYPSIKDKTFVFNLPTSGGAEPAYYHLWFVTTEFISYIDFGGIRYTLPTFDEYTIGGVRYYRHRTTQRIKEGTYTIKVGY